MTLFGAAAAHWEREVQAEIDWALTLDPLQVRRPVEVEATAEVYWELFDIAGTIEEEKLHG